MTAAQPLGQPLPPLGHPLGHHWGTPKKHMGAASELRASAHLLSQGYDVYRSVAPHAGFDLVASRGNELVRVEVKSVSRPSSASHCPPFGWPTNDEWDLLLIVGPDVVFQFAAGAVRAEAAAAIRGHFGLATAAQQTYRERVRGLLDGSAGQVWTARTAALALDIDRGAASHALVELDEAGVIERLSRGSYRGLTRGDNGGP